MFNYSNACVVTDFFKFVSFFPVVTKALFGREAEFGRLELDPHSPGELIEIIEGDPVGQRLSCQAQLAMLKLFRQTELVNSLPSVYQCRVESKVLVDVID